MHRLPIETPHLCEASVQLQGEAAHHLKVLRPREGEMIELFDGKGSSRVYAYKGGLLHAQAPCITFPKPATQLTLFACITKGSRWDWTIEKATELGATRIVGVISDRCIVRIPPLERPSKAERWRRIAQDAARQSDAVWLPEIPHPVDFQTALSWAEKTCCFAGILSNPPPPPILQCAAIKALTSSNTPPTQHLSLFTGPEGDFTPEELAALSKIANPVSFGPTILRAETAAIFGLSLLSAIRHSFQH